MRLLYRMLLVTLVVVLLPLSVEAREDRDPCATDKAITMGTPEFDYKPKSLEDAVQRRKDFYASSSPDAKFRVTLRTFQSYKGSILRFSDANKCQVIAFIMIKQDGRLYEYSAVFGKDFYKSMKNFWFSVGK